MNVNKKEEKFVHIRLKEDIISILKEYSKKSGMDMMSLGHLIGYLTAFLKDDEASTLAVLNQLFFYAGIYYAKEHKKNIKYGYKSESQVKDIRKELKKTPQYMG